MLTLLLVLFVLLSVADIMTTHQAMIKGLYEYNFVLRFLYKRFGTKGHVVFKIITAAMFLPVAHLISLEAIVVINIIFAVIVINNLWVIEHVRN